MNNTYTVVRSKRKTISIQIKSDGSIIVRAPRRASNYDIASFVQSKEDWINKHLIEVREEAAKEEDIVYLTDEEIKYITGLAKTIIPSRVEYYADLMGVDYGRVTIKHQKTRWGSCSGKKNLNFNCLLMLTPPEVLDSVVVHELCHLKEMNHSKRFYDEVYKVFPDYDECDKWIKKNGRSIIQRLK